MLHYEITHIGIEFKTDLDKLHLETFNGIDCTAEDVEKSLAALAGELVECVDDELHLMIEELVYPKAYANGDINYHDVYAQYEALVLSNIDKTFAGSYTEIRALDTEKKIDGYKKIEWKERAITTVEEIHIALCGYVEEMIEKFVEISTWHYGTNEQNLSILWYGLEGEKPIPKWTITYGQPLDNMWFEEEHWFLLEDLVDGCDDCFATWYIDECAASLPYMSAILKECPIAFEKNDSIEDINKKMDEYFSKQK